MPCLMSRIHNTSDFNMSSSPKSSPLSNTDIEQLRASSDPFKQNAEYMSTASVDVTRLAAYPAYHSYSNSTSPSSFNTPAEHTSDPSVFSEYDFAADDEFLAIDFDTTEQAIEADVLLFGDILLPTTEVSTVDRYQPQQQAHTGQIPEGANNPIYTLNSSQSTLQSRQSLRSETHAVTAKTPSPPEPSQSGISLQAHMPYDNSTKNMQRMQDLDPGSLNMKDSGTAGVGPHMGHSPRVTLTTWETMATEIPAEMDQQDIHYGGQPPSWHEGYQNQTTSVGGFPDVYTLQPLVDAAHSAAEQDETEGHDFDEENGRTGLDPSRRKSLSDVEMPNFKDQEKYALQREKKIEIEAWSSEAVASTNFEDSSGSSSFLGTPSVHSRPRASTTGGFLSHPGLNPAPFMTTLPPEDEADVDTVSDEGERENQLKAGQIYFNKTAMMNEADLELMRQSHQFNGIPMYPYITHTEFQAATANDAMQRWNKVYDNFSVISRAATWGTRRRSEPSISDIESIHNGSFLKRLSFKSSKEKEKRPSPFTPLRESLDHLAGIVRRKSDSKLKRSRSSNGGGAHFEVPTIKQENQSNLAPPFGAVGPQKIGATSPRLNTNVGNSARHPPGHGRSGSNSASAVSPKGVVAAMGSAIRRARSGSNLQQDTSKGALAGLWQRESGGPPVPTLASPPLEDEIIKQQDYSDAEGEDDDEDEPADDGEVMDFGQATPITPNFNGFLEHVRQLYPMMEKQNYLLERIAHQQVVRYKALLGCRVKHSGAIANSTCAAGTHCIAMGGSATPLEPKGHAHNTHPDTGGLQIMTDISDGDSNPEGALGPESFPLGVPMPPTHTLPAEFECQLCFRVKRFQKPSDWTKHVHEDVQPFTCTYANCKEPKSFKRKADWVRHENERHRRLGWWTCTVDDCTHKCYRKDNFLQHLVREHKIPEPKSKTKAAAKKARNSEEEIWVMIRNCHHETTAKPQDEPCKFCGKILTSWKKLTVHLAKHMEGLSLSVLRLVQQQQVDANTIISPVEPLAVRQEPLTPVGQDRRASNESAQYGSMSASLSPNTQAMPHFSSPAYPQNFSPIDVAMHRYSPVSIYGQNMGYATTTTGQAMPTYMAQAPTSQTQQGIDMMYDNRAIQYNGLDQLRLDQIESFVDTTPSRGFPVMDHSPHLEQSGGFSGVNGYSTTPITQAGYHSYASSNQTLSPDPSTFVSAPQRMPAYQTQTLVQMQSSLTPSPQSHTPNYAVPQQMLGVMDDNTYKYQGVSTTGNEIDYDQASFMGGRGGQGYPPSSNSGYGYHRQ